MFRTMGGGKRNTEKKAFSFGGSWSGSNVGGDDTSLNEGQDTVTSETLSRVEEKENDRSNAVTQPQTPLKPAAPVVKPTPVVQAPEPSQADTDIMINAAKPITPEPVVPKTETTPKIQFMAPEPEPSKLGPNTGMTISSDDNSIAHRDKFPENTGATISTYSGGESGPKETSNVYKDPNTGSTIATKGARENIADGGNYNVVASTDANYATYTPTNAERPNMGFSQTGVEAPSSTGDVLKSGGGVDDPYAQEQDRILTNTYNPRPSEDLATGDTLQYSSRTSTDAINPRVNTAVRRALLDLGKAGGQLRRFFIR